MQMRISVIPWPTMLLFVLLAVSPAFGGGPERFAGTWYDVRYLETIAATGSPRKGVETVPIPRFSVRKSAGKWLWEIDFRFHEVQGFTVGGVTDTGNGRLRIDAEPKLDGGVIDLFIPGNDGLLTWERHEGGRIATGTFRRVEENFPNRLLVGDWTDDQGRTFSFSGNGIYHSRAETFPFGVGLDYTFARCDYLESTDRTITDENGFPLRYGFSLAGGVLKLYRVTYWGGEWLQCADAPFLVLRRKTAR